MHALSAFVSFLGTNLVTRRVRGWRDGAGLAPRCTMDCGDRSLSDPGAACHRESWLQEPYGAKFLLCRVSSTDFPTGIIRNPTSTLSSVDLSFPPKPVHLSELCERCGEGNGRSSESNLLVLPKLCFDVHRSLLKTTSDLSLHCGSPAVSAHCLFVDAVAFSPGCPNACAVQF